MPRAELDVETTLPPEHVREMLLDFSERRPERWPGISPEVYEVVDRGETWADVKEGTKAAGMAIWAIEHYDWSDPHTVVWTVKESNFSTVGSSVSAEIRPGEAGGSRIHISWQREGTSLLGKILIRMIGLTNAKPVRASIEKALRAEEARAAES